MTLCLNDHEGPGTYSGGFDVEDKSDWDKTIRKESGQVSGTMNRSINSWARWVVVQVEFSGPFTW